MPNNKPIARILPSFRELADAHELAARRLDGLAFLAGAAAELLDRAADAAEAERTATYAEAVAADAAAKAKEADVESDHPLSIAAELASRKARESRDTAKKARAEMDAAKNRNSAAAKNRNSATNAAKEQ